MTVSVSFSKAPYKKTYDAAVLCFYQDKTPSKPVNSLNYEFSGFVDHALEKAVKFSGKMGQIEVMMLPEGAPYPFMVMLGFGDQDKLDAVKAEKIGGKLYAALDGKGIKSVELYADNEIEEGAMIAAHVATGFKSRSYRFDKYHTIKDKDECDIKPETLHMVIFDADKARDFFSVQDAVLDGVFFARDLVNEPPNVLYPESYVKRIKDKLKPLGVEVEVLDEKKMAKLGMNALLAVGQGSDRASQMVIMRWHGDKDDTDAPLAFVGKGVTFDTGGISLKPGPGMEEMKMDMGGSAAVVGAMIALAKRKAKANVIGVVGLVENMPSSRAYRPADIITSYSGKTIEVLNTDAEGRLVLVDALSYVQERFKPALIIDLATLTGAMLVALGHEYCGTFATDDGLWEQMEQAGAQTQERLWRMPLDEAWKKDMEGTISDVQNMAKSGRWAGSCTAAAFLWHFIEDGTHWAHMDIAGMAWTKTDTDTVPKYGTGFGVRVLDRFVANNYESS